jgi:hypothetical protein
MQQSRIASGAAQKPMVVEINGEPMGVLVPAEVGYRFLAVRLPAFVLDGQLFSGLLEAQDALSLALDTANFK